MKTLPIVTALFLAFATLTGCDKAGQTGPLDLNEDQQAATCDPCAKLDEIAKAVAPVQMIPTTPTELEKAEIAVKEADQKAAQARAQLLKEKLATAETAVKEALAKATANNTSANRAAVKKAIASRDAAQRAVDANPINGAALAADLAAKGYYDSALAALNAASGSQPKAKSTAPTTAQAKPTATDKPCDCPTETQADGSEPVDGDTVANAAAEQRLRERTDGKVYSAAHNGRRQALTGRP